MSKTNEKNYDEFMEYLKEQLNILSNNEDENIRKAAEEIRNKIPENNKIKETFDEFKVYCKDSRTWSFEMYRNYYKLIDLIDEYHYEKNIIILPYASIIYVRIEEDRNLVIYLYGTQIEKCLAYNDQFISRDRVFTKTNLSEIRSFFDAKRIAVTKADFENFKNQHTYSSTSPNDYYPIDILLAEIFK